MSDPKSTVKVARAATAETPQERVEKTTQPAKPATGKKPVAKTAANGKIAAATTARKLPVKDAKAVAKVQVDGKAAKAKATPVAPAKNGKENKVKKTAAPKKPKLIRDSFTFPASDYALIGELKEKAVQAGKDVKKSELLRAGLAALASMSTAQLLKAVDGVERIKTGRPTK